MYRTASRITKGARTAAAYHWMPTRQRRACDRKSRRPRAPEVRELMVMAARKGPNVPSTKRIGAAEPTLPIPWSAAAAGSQQSHEMAKA